MALVFKRKMLIRQNGYILQKKNPENIKRVIKCEL